PLRRGGGQAGGSWHREVPSASPVFHDLLVALVSVGLLLVERQTLAPVVVAEERLADAPPRRRLLRGLGLRVRLVGDAVGVAALLPPPEEDGDLVAVVLGRNRGQAV